MEQLHWVRYRCQQLWATDQARGWYSSPGAVIEKYFPQRISGRRRTVLARWGPHQEEYHTISKGYKGNVIRTTKYSILTFIPMNLFQQFHRAANLYFLFLALLNWVPVVEAFQKEITMIPLLLVLTVISIKDALEDYRRYMFDKKINNNTVTVYCRTKASAQILMANNMLTAAANYCGSGLSLCRLSAREQRWTTVNLCGAVT